ncbi:hypothetical protein FACS1894216_16330 [Synergistales bacterium]|nr:hypothetical protein FACS1894216_16330 [Synergistales bacterium]
MNVEELKAVLAKHKAWLDDEEGGVNANLSETDLRGANLSYADLRGADLSGADLRDANLREAKGIDGLISVSFIGSRKGITLYDAERDSIRCGCFEGTLEQLREKNAARTDGEVWKAEYEAAIEFFEKIRAIRGGREDGSGKEKNKITVRREEEE